MYIPLFLSFLLTCYLFPLSNPPKVTEIFSIKTHKVHDLSGNKVDLHLYDRISSIISFKGPNNEKIIIAGLGARDYSPSFPYSDSYFEKNCIIRSTDNGKTWISLTPKGKTDRKVYGLSTNNKGVVIAVTGDRGHSCILSSIDYGLNWKVVLSNSQLKNTKNAFYNSYYSKSRNLFLIPTGDGTYITKDGIHFNKGEYDIPLARNGYVFEELDQIWIASQWGNNFLSVLHSGEHKYNKVLTSIDKKQFFSTVKYLGKGIFLAISYQYPGSTYKEYRAIKFERKHNILYLTIPNHNLKEGLVTMDIKSNSELYSTIQNGLELKVVDKNTIKMNQKGINIIKNNIKIVIRIYTDDKMKKGTLYRSTDFGKNWKSVELRAATFNYGMIWSRDIIHIGNGVVYINFPGDENKAENECAMFIKSEDYGKTWKITDDILGKGNEKINAIYRSILHVDGSILAGAQNYARILRLE